MDINTLKDRILASISNHEKELCEASDGIWDNPEIGFHEKVSSDILQDILRSNGFTIEPGIDGMPTAFAAKYGSGQPVIGFLGEFDALAAMSQRSGCALREPVCAGAAGHGCGHNLLGVGAAAAAIAAKELIEDEILSGTVVYFGCPAEETGSAKAFLARDGAFNGIDAFLTWHPWDCNGVWVGTTAANVKLIFRFRGQSAHAAGAPHLGRSALDAQELMNVGVQFLREHIPDDVRIHYAITNAGGDAPNVVQAYAESVYLIRSPRTDELSDIYQRVIDCAKGAAMMTGTRVDVEFVKGCSSTLPNTVLGEAMDKCMHCIDLPIYSEDDLELAKSLQDSLEAPLDTLAAFGRCLPSDMCDALLAHRGGLLSDFILPFYPTEGMPLSISTDVGDASWCAPTCQIIADTWAIGTPAHSWQAVAAGKSGFAHKGMLYAGKVLGLCAALLMSDEALISRAKNEFTKRIQRHPYVCPIPKEIKPKIE